MDRAKLEKAIKLARLIDANSNVNEALAAAKALAKVVLSMEPPPAPKNGISNEEAKKKREEILRQEKERQREKARKTAERIILACQVCGKASFFSPCSECDPITKTVQCDRCGGDKIGGVPCQACFGRGFLLAKGDAMKVYKLFSFDPWVALKEGVHYACPWATVVLRLPPVSPWCESDVTDFKACYDTTKKPHPLLIFLDPIEAVSRYVDAEKCAETSFLLGIPYEYWPVSKCDPMKKGRCYFGGN